MRGQQTTRQLGQSDSKACDPRGRLTQCFGENSPWISWEGTVDFGTVAAIYRYAFSRLSTPGMTDHERAKTEGRWAFRPMSLCGQRRRLFGHGIGRRDTTLSPSRSSACAVNRICCKLPQIHTLWRLSGRLWLTDAADRKGRSPLTRCHSLCKAAYFCVSQWDSVDA